MGGSLITAARITPGMCMSIRGGRTSIWRDVGRRRDNAGIEPQVNSDRRGLPLLLAAGARIRLLFNREKGYVTDPPKYLSFSGGGHLMNWKLISLTVLAG